MGVVGSLGLLSGCGSRTDEYVFNEIQAYDIEKGVNTFRFKLDKKNPIKITEVDRNTRFVLLSPNTSVKLANWGGIHSRDMRRDSEVDRRGYTIDNIDYTGEYQLVVGSPNDNNNMSILQSSYPRLTEAKFRRRTSLGALAGELLDDDVWKIDLLSENNWEIAKKIIQDSGEITEYLTPSEAGAPRITEAIVLEEIVESNNYELDANQENYNMAILLQKIYAILEQMRTSLQGAINQIVSIFLQALYFKFGNTYEIVEEPLRDSIRKAIANQLSVGMGPIISEDEDTISYVLFFTGTSSFTMRDPSSGQPIAPPLPEVDITAKIKIDANIDTKIPYELSLRSAELHDEMVLIETGE